MATPWVESDLPLPAEPYPGADPDLERFGRLVAGHLGVPVAMVSVVTPTEELILGAVGLPPAIDAARRLPLTHALCLEVVRTGAPVVVDDARDHDVLAAHAAVTDLDVVAYAGCPLHDDAGQVVGSLCAIDSVPRRWTADQLDYLADLAAACSSELRLRAERERAQRAQHQATDAVRHSRLLLTMAEAFTAAATVDEVTRAVSRVGAIGLGATMTGVALLDADGQGLTYTSLDAFDGYGFEALRHARLTDERPSTQVVRTRLPMYFRDWDALLARFPAVAHDVRGDQPAPPGALAVLPLSSRGRVLGVLTLGWPGPRDFQQENREVKAALAAYTAQSLERALLLDQRRTVARTLQDAMLTDLPQPGRFRLAARYLPAAQADQVGGDWYDGLVLPDGDLAVMVGDVTGHDMDAAARMGQLRSTLRAFAWDRPDASPSSWLARLDRAVAGLGLATVASALAVRFSTRDQDVVRAQWSTAGHLPPVLVRPGDEGRVLDRRTDMLLGVDPGRARADHHADLRPGDTLVLYTDGLVERRSVPLPDALVGLARAAGGLADREPEQLVRELAAALVDGQPADDVAVLAVRVLPPPPT